MPSRISKPVPSQIDTTVRYGDWRDDLFDNGFAVVKGVIGREKAGEYSERMLSWLEKFQSGFDRNDKSTWRKEKLPHHMKGGMYHDYAVQHESFVWEARTEPGVLDAFSLLWGTDELLVSFDGINLTVPVPHRVRTEPWPHIDQAPTRKGLVCAQGIINFAENGPHDGGLIVVQGSHRLIDEFFTRNPGAIGRKTWGPKDWFGFHEEEVAWFERQGCHVQKVCAEPGDLIIWDSRTVHYNTLPESEQVRSIIYACYGPACFATEKDLRLKAQLFRERKGTTHWPNMEIYKSDGGQISDDPFARDIPFDDVKETKQVLKLAGVVPY